MTHCRRITLTLLLVTALFLLPLLRLAFADDWLSAEQVAPPDAMYGLEEFAITENLPNEWLNVLLLGSDVRFTSDYGDTDSITLLSINLATKQAKLTSFVRDMRMSMNGRTVVDRLGAACRLGGPELAMRTINERFGLNIQYFALVNMSAMAEIIDLLGGLDMNITNEERDALNRGLFDLSSMSDMKRLEQYGENVHLNGNQAVAYARIRNIDSELRRTQRQRDTLICIARRLQQESSDTLVGVVMKLLENVETNMDLTQLMTIAAAGLQVNLDAVEQFRIPVDKTFDPSALDGQSTIHPDYSINRKLLQQFIYGAPEPQTGN